MGGKFEADLDISTDFTYAAAKDALQYTIDYEKIYKIIIGLSEHKKYHLIESLAVIIVDTLLAEFDNIKQVTIRLRKKNPPIGGVVDSVEVEVTKNRNEQ